MRPALHAVTRMAAAVVLAVLVSVVSLVAIARVEWPAFNSSNQLHAITTVGQFVCLVGLFASGWLWRRGRQLIASTLSALSLAALSTVTLAMPLGATKLYLFGVSVDQQFRTEYLTRLTDTASPHDMTYIGLPPFYPPGWFWLGGRLADLTGTPAWEMFKPWSIVSITAAIVVAFVLWASMIRFELALVVATATAAATLAYAPAEPYAAIITVLLPPVFVLAWSGLRAGGRSGPRPSGGQERSDPGDGHGGQERSDPGGRRGWAAVVGVGLFLGLAALFYTLLLAYAAFTLVVMALLAAAGRRSWDPLLRLAAITVISGALALIGWGPYLLAASKGSPAKSGTAQHYLPADGAQLTFPMLDFTLLGALCMVGTLWLVVYARSSTRAGALAVGIVAVYGWSLLSMLTTLVGTTLLSFRLQPTLTVLLTAAGAFGFVEATLAVATRYAPRTRQRVVAVGAAIGAIGAMTFTQDIPDVLRPDIVVAYTDTDGTGQRADRRPPGAEQYYRAVDDRIGRVTGLPRNETVVMTADYSFLAYYPYYGFQGLTSHYANPLAHFDARSAAIEEWATITKPDRFIAALDALPWQPPTVFLMRHGANDTYTLRLASDVYPNQPNVRRYQVALEAALFDDPRWDVSDIGPFVLAIRR